MIYKLITNNFDLTEEINNIKAAKYIALDTEFTRQHSFWPKLCTLQICYKKDYAIIIDCLADINLDILFATLCDDNIVKILHGGKQDLEIILHLYGKIPKNIFDTQIAAMLINQPSECSYKTLVHNLLDISIDKTQKISDWSHRPLSNKQIKYAAYDVLYLYQIYEIIIERLSSEKKLDWLINLFDDLIDTKKYIVNVQKHLSKIYSSSSTPLSYFIANKLFLWRENKAQQLDTPRNHILHIDSIKELSFITNEGSEYLMEKIVEQFHNLNDAKVQIYALEIFDIINECHLEKEENMSAIFPKKNIALNKLQTIFYMILQNILETTALKYNVHANIIALDNDIKQLILYKEKASTKILSKWRYEIFGNKALEFLTEKRGIFIKDEVLSIK